MPEPSTLLTCIAALMGFMLFPGPEILLTLARSSISGMRVRDPVIAKMEMLRSARMAAMRKLRCGGRRHDE